MILKLSFKYQIIIEIIVAPEQKRHYVTATRIDKFN